MKPYTLTLSAAEVVKLTYALKRGAFYANEAEKRGVVGGAEIAKQIEEYAAILNKPFDGGYESEAERSAAALKSFGEEVASHTYD
jgi:hypothetical protein